MKNPYATDFSHTNLCLRPNLQTEQECGINMKKTYVTSHPLHIVMVGFYRGGVNMFQILVVEDDWDIQEVLENHLCGSGYEVTLASRISGLDNTAIESVPEKQ